MQKNILALAAYVGKWVALNSKTYKVLVSGNSVKEVEERLKKIAKVPDSVVITFITPLETSLAPIFR